MPSSLHATDLGSLLDHLDSFKGVAASSPFDETSLVYKVMGKMFTIVSLDSFEQGDPRMNLKCDPDRAVQLREEYEEWILPGYHMSKKHWNTLRLVPGGIPMPLIGELIQHSYDLVVAGLTKKLQAELHSL